MVAACFSFQNLWRDVVRGHGAWPPEHCSGGEEKGDKRQHSGISFVFLLLHRVSLSSGILICPTMPTTITQQFTQKVWFKWRHVYGMLERRPCIVCRPANGFINTISDWSATGVGGGEERRLNQCHVMSFESVTITWSWSDYWLFLFLIPFRCLFFCASLIAPHKSHPWSNFILLLRPFRFSFWISPRVVGCRRVCLRMDLDKNFPNARPNICRIRNQQMQAHDE